MKSGPYANSNNNPYRSSPFYPVKTTNSKSTFNIAKTNYATFWQRLGAHLTDGILYTSMSRGIVFLLTNVMYSPGTHIDKLPYSQQITFNIVCILGHIFLVYFPVFIILPGLTGYTLGKKMRNLLVLDPNTNKPIGILRTIKRSAMGIVSTLALGVGYFWMLKDNQKRTWHDIVSDSIVVKVDKI